jgi:hypothetical protein
MKKIRAASLVEPRRMADKLNVQQEKADGLAVLQF